MKNEPLHLKALWLRDYGLATMEENIKNALMRGKDPEDHVFHAKDIKSAVEWLKEQLIKKMETKYKGKVCYPYTVVGDTIDKAFPDLQETHKEGKKYGT